MDNSKKKGTDHCCIGIAGLILTLFPTLDLKKKILIVPWANPNMKPDLKTFLNNLLSPQSNPTDPFDFVFVSFFQNRKKDLKESWDSESVLH